SLDHINEVAITRRRSFRITRECGEHAFLVVADLPGTRRSFLVLVVGEMREVAAHQTSRLFAVGRACLVIKIRDLLKTSERHRRCKGRDNHAAAETSCKLDRRLRE